jgi:hypothetical protein
MFAGYQQGIEPACYTYMTKKRMAIDLPHDKDFGRLSLNPITNILWPETNTDACIQVQGLLWCLRSTQEQYLRHFGKVEGAPAL